MHGTIQRKRVDTRWTEGEDEILMAHYPDHDALSRLMPHRTYNACKTRAKVLSFKTRDRGKEMTVVEVKRLKALCECFSSMETIAAIMGRNVRTIEAAMVRRGYTLKRAKPVKSGNDLYDSVRERAFDMGLAYRDLDRSLGHKWPFFSRPSKAHKTSIGMIAKAVEALGGRLVIEWQSLDDEDES